MVNGLWYGYERFEFRWGATRYLGAVAEKPTKLSSFLCSLFLFTLLWPQLLPERVGNMKKSQLVTGFGNLAMSMGS